MLLLSLVSKSGRDKHFAHKHASILCFQEGPRNVSSVRAQPYLPLVSTSPALEAAWPVVATGHVFVQHPSEPGAALSRPVCHSPRTPSQSLLLPPGPGSSVTDRKRMLVPLPWQGSWEDMAEAAGRPGGRPEGHRTPAAPSWPLRHVPPESKPFRHQGGEVKREKRGCSRSCRAAAQDGANAERKQAMPVVGGERRLGPPRPGQGGREQGGGRREALGGVKPPLATSPHLPRHRGHLTASLTAEELPARHSRTQHAPPSETPPRPWSSPP